MEVSPLTCRTPSPRGAPLIPIRRLFFPCAASEARIVSVAGKRWKKSGFTELGVLRPDRLGLPKKLAREMSLQRAWAEVAGPAIARRATPRRIRRGVLEIEVDDAGWAATLRELLPTLAGRLATRFPELGLRKCRLFVANQPDIGEAFATAEATPPAVPESEGPRESATQAGTSRSIDLNDLMERYLARRGGE